MTNPQPPTIPPLARGSGFDAFRLQLPTDDDALGDAVIVWPADDRDGLYFAGFPDDMATLGLIGRAFRMSGGTVILGSARVVHAHDGGELDAGWHRAFSASGLAQLWSARALLPRLVGRYFVGGESEPRDPETGFVSTDAQAAV